MGGKHLKQSMLASCQEIISLKARYSSVVLLGQETATCVEAHY